MKKRYSGPLSKPFWERIRRLPRSQHDYVYGLGCVLQNQEDKTLAALAIAEGLKVITKKRAKKPYC